MRFHNNDDDFWVCYLLCVQTNIKHCFWHSIKKDKIFIFFCLQPLDACFCKFAAPLPS